MNPKSHIKSPTLKEIASLSLPEAIKQAVLENIEIAKECGERIREEGIVVRDLTGSVVEHPAIKCQQGAIKTYSELIKKHATSFAFK